ncbi:hypothetical protein B0H14DRAFT_3536566 [Mycena olivaceomarginata]|nr:hypothetical protein B0H14DRAFT_3536566 [Mycena olivaceomarginata]
MRLLYLLWTGFFSFGFLFAALKRHDIPSSGMLSASCLVTMDDALAGVPAAGSPAADVTLLPTLSVE